MNRNKLLAPQTDKTEVPVCLPALSTQSILFGPPPSIIQPMSIKVSQNSFQSQDLIPDSDCTLELGVVDTLGCIAVP